RPPSRAPAPQDQPPDMSVDVDWLRRRYLEDQAPVSAIAAEAGVDRSTIHRWLHAADIPPRGPVGRRDWDKILTPRALRAARKRGEEPADIARRFGAPYKVVADRLRNLG